jgi:hypothetical protein
MLHIEFAFHRLDPYGSGVTCPWIFYYRTYACNSFAGYFFYTVSHRNLKLSRRFFCVKLHIEFTFHHRDPYGYGVNCPWILCYKTYACNSFLSPIAGPLVMASITPASSFFLPRWMICLLNLMILSLPRWMICLLNLIIFLCPDEWYVCWIWTREIWDAEAAHQKYTGYSGWHEC